VVQGQYLFPHRNDPNRPTLKVNNAHDRVIESLEKEGIAPFRHYDFRHTFASRTAIAGMDLVTLAAILGHSRIEMVLRYAKPSFDHQAEQVKRVERFNAGKQIAEYEKRRPSTGESLQVSLQ